MEQNVTHQIDVSKGSLRSDVSQQWMKRPDDQRFTSLADLEAQVAKWRAESWEETIAPREILPSASTENGLVIDITTKERGVVTVSPTHYGFNALCAAAACPSGYLRSLPAPLAALNLQFGLRVSTQAEHGVYLRQNGEAILRALTGPRYGRIFDEDVVKAVRTLAGNGTGDTRWKVPGCIEWGGTHGISYNPEVDITKQNTTLYASDRDMFVFLVDDTHPIEIGKLANGQPDLVFRGFFIWNSEVGNRTFGIACFYLRGVCQNRNLWGVEGFSELTFKHTHTAPQKFIEAAMPALLSFTEGATDKLITGVKEAKARIVAVTDEERVAFLASPKAGAFAEKQAKAIIATAEKEEGKPPESVWDFAQGISAHARRAAHQDQRLDLEIKAGKLLDRLLA